MDHLRILLVPDARGLTGLDDPDLAHRAQDDLPRRVRSEREAGEVA